MPKPLLIRILLVLISSVFMLFSAHAQEPPRREIDMQQFVQELFPVPSEDINYSDLFESLFQLYDPLTPI